MYGKESQLQFPHKFDDFFRQQFKVQVLDAQHV